MFKRKFIGSLLVSGSSGRGHGVLAQAFLYVGISRARHATGEPLGQKALQYEKSQCRDEEGAGDFHAFATLLHDARQIVLG